MLVEVGMISVGGVVLVEGQRDEHSWNRTSTDPSLVHRKSLEHSVKGSERRCRRVVQPVLWTTGAHTHIGISTPLPLSLLSPSTDWKDNGYVRWTSVHGCTTYACMACGMC